MEIFKKLKFILMGILLVNVQSKEVMAQAGSFDLTFGTNGIVTTDLGNTDQAHAIVIQPDGKIIVAGQKGLSVPADIALLRYNLDGTLDNTFGINGHVITDVTGNSDVAWAICLQPDGKIVVAGTSYTIHSEDIAVLRYNADGTLDSAFGNNGVTLTDVYGADTTDLTDNNDYGWAMALQADGKIVIGGYSSDEGMDHNITLFRYNTNGVLDTTFDYDGIAITPMGLPLYMDEIRSIVIQPDGKILAAGSATYTPSSGYRQFVVVRYNTDGSLDSSFDNDGMVNTLIGNIHASAYSMVLQPDGKIVMAGISYNGTDVDFALVRYLINGSLDLTFDSDGKVITPIGFGGDWLYSVNIQPDGKIITCGGIGYNNIPSNFDFALSRYNTDGSLDISFDGDGILTTSIGSSYAVGYSMALQADGKIVAAGWSDMGVNSDDITLVRYNNNIAGVGISENNVNSNVQVFPNPTNGKCYIGMVEKETQVTISNVLGTEFYKKKILPQKIQEIDLSTLAKGVYIVNLTDERGVVIQKIIKK